MKTKPPPQVVLLHPTMGFGGGERLILQLSRALRRGGWSTRFLMNQYDPNRSFPEAKDECIELVQNRVPSSIGGRVKAWCNYLRLRTTVAQLAKQPRPDLIVVDFIPHVIPFIKRRLPGVPVLCYCHFPDWRLEPRLTPRWYQFYRRPFEALEVRGFEMADTLLVNSYYTQKTLLEGVPSLSPEQVRVVSPGVEKNSAPLPIPSERSFVLSLGRIHSSKYHHLAIEAFHHAKLPADAKLLIAGGLDPTDPSNESELRHLKRHAQSLGVAARIQWEFNPTDEAMEQLWKRTRILLYPPPAEHFGIVPLESMARGIPVIAVNEGGPRETIQSGTTGILCPPTSTAMGDALKQVWLDEEAYPTMAANARQHVSDSFGITQFEAAIQHEAEELISR